jgi:hypothetical protein
MTLASRAKDALLEAEGQQRAEPEAERVEGHHLRLGFSVPTTAKGH